MEIFGTCNPVVHTEGNTVNDNKIVTVSLLFYGCKASQFPACYVDDMLWIILKWSFHTHGCDTLDMKSLVVCR